MGELVRYADDGVVLCRSRGQARAALDAVGEILAGLGLQLHPDKTRIVDLREGREGFDFLGCHFRARMSGRLWEQRRVRPLLPAPLALAEGDEAAAGEGQGPHRSPPGRGAGYSHRDRGSQSDPARLGQLLPHRAMPPTSSARSTDYVVWRLRTLMIKKRGRNLRAGQAQAVDRGLVQRAGPVPVAWHHPISEGGVAQPRRSSVSRVRENRTHGIERGMGKRTRKGTAPLTTNDGRDSQLRGSF